LGLAFVGIGAVVWAKRGGMGASSSLPSATTIQHLAQIVCKNEILPKIVNAYPQAKMTQEELQKQTLGEGMARLQQFHDQLPSVIDPIVPELKNNASAWNEIEAMAKEASQLAHVRKAQSEITQKVQKFTSIVKSEVKTRCPASLEQPENDRYAEFAVGALLGYLGSK
jgi:hypothetical protein